ncbi:MAG: phosphoribosylformylglycinamidine cyclo-ligase, partial [Propionibacteriaceae bacterium]|nr:phosphoribosylformylglycinamidine cyclo-ligase [Propionibacteriaceae bacterium]
VRHVLLNQAGWSLDQEVAELGRTLGEELLVPTRVYARDCLALIDAVEVHAMSHITGGGLANNLARVVPNGVQVDLDRSSWRPDPIFDVVQSVGNVSQPDLEATLNMGVGMVAILPPSEVDAAVALLAERGLKAWVAGAVRAADGSSDRPAVSLIGQHPR